MEDKLKDMQKWAESLKSQLEETKTAFESHIDSMPYDIKKDIVKQYKNIDFGEMQKMAAESAQNMYNHIKSKL